MPRDRLFTAEEGVFSYRTGGILIHGGRVWLQPSPGDEPGGVRTDLSHVWAPLSRLNRLERCPPETISLPQEEPEGAASFISRS